MSLWVVHVLSSFPGNVDAAFAVSPTSNQDCEIRVASANIDFETRPEYPNIVVQAIGSTQNQPNFRSKKFGIRMITDSFSSKCFMDWSVAWLISWFLDWLIDWLIDRTIDWLIDWLIDWSIDRLIDWLIELVEAVKSQLTCHLSFQSIRMWPCRSSTSTTTPHSSSSPTRVWPVAGTFPPSM